MEIRNRLRTLQATRNCPPVYLEGLSNSPNSRIGWRAAYGKQTI